MSTQNQTWQFKGAGLDRELFAKTLPELKTGLRFIEKHFVDFNPVDWKFLDYNPMKYQTVNIFNLIDWKVLTVFYC